MVVGVENLEEVKPSFLNEGNIMELEKIYREAFLEGEAFAYPDEPLEYTLQRFLNKVKNRREEELEEELEEAYWDMESQVHGYGEYAGYQCSGRDAFKRVVRRLLK